MTIFGLHLGLHHHVISYAKSKKSKEKQQEVYKRKSPVTNCVTRD